MGNLNIICILRSYWLAHTSPLSNSCYGLYLGNGERQSYQLKSKTMSNWSQIISCQSLCRLQYRILHITLSNLHNYWLLRANMLISDYANEVKPLKTNHKFTFIEPIKFERILKDTSQSTCVSILLIKTLSTYDVINSSLTYCNEIEVFLEPDKFLGDCAIFN